MIEILFRVVCLPKFLDILAKFFLYEENDFVEKNLKI